MSQLVTSTDTSGDAGACRPAAVSRRDALKALIGIAGAVTLLGSPRLARAAEASKETTDALANAQAQFNQAQSELDALSAEFEALSRQLDETMGAIENVQGDIDDTQAQIDENLEKLEAKQEVLADRVSTSYKSGGNSALSLLLSSASFDELISNVYYIEKVNARDKSAIADIHAIQDELEAQKAELEQQKSELEALKSDQTEQLSNMKAKKDEVQTLLDGLNSEVQQLISKRDAEILAAAQAEEKARKQASSGGATYIPGSGQDSIAAGTAQQRIVQVAKTTPSPGVGLCAWWVADVFERAGFGSVPGNADDMYANYCTSSNKANLKVGMIIAVPSHPHTSAGRIYGHVGIYIGDNTVMDNIGYIRSISVDSWIAYYGLTSTPRWGWAKGINLEG